MAEVSNLHRLNHRSTRTIDQEGQHEPPVEEFDHQPNPFILDFESSSPSYYSSDPYFFDDYSTSFDFGFDVNEHPGWEYEDPNFFYGGDEDDEQMNFVTDLFESSRAMKDPIWELGSNSGLEFDLGPGLRVAGTDSESDTEEFEVNSISRFCDNNTDVMNDDIFESSNRNNYRVSENEREEFEWEEVSERVHFDVTGNLNSVISRIAELSVSVTHGEGMMLDDDEEEEDDNDDVDVDDDDNGDDDDEEGAEEQSNTEWEFLLAVSNLERTFELDDLEQNDNYILGMEYDALFGQLVENENALKGSPPAAKSVVENLPSVVLRKEEVGEDNTAVFCAICKDEVEFGEKVTRMPCCHLYHGDCILPWLKIRNTCPVCRYELPTDDADYEKRSSETGRSRLSALLVNDLEVRYNFELLP